MGSQPVIDEVIAVVFAAGLGTRLLPVTADVPKPLAPVLDVPLIDLAVSAVSAVASPIVVNAGHLGEPLGEHLRGAPIELFRERPAPYGNAATLRGVIDRIGATVVTYNCDLVSDLDLRLLLDAHRDGGRLATLACKEVKERADFVTAGGTLRLVNRRVRSEPGYLFLGAACFERDAVAAIPHQRPLGLVQGLIQPLLARDAIHLYRHEGYAKDAGTLTNLLQINLDALRGEITVPFPGRVVTSEDGRAYIGPGADVATESMNTGAVIGAGASVHPDARISTSLIWKNERVPAGTMRDCIFFRGEAIATTETPTPDPPG